MSSPKRLPLTPMQQQQIVAAIRAGGFTQVAAESFGLSPVELDACLRRGQAKRSRLRSLANDLRQAAAQARLRAEMTVFAAEPRIWLEHGPGRDRPDHPGWSTAVKPVGETALSVNALLDPQFVQAINEFGTDLKAAPEIRAHVVLFPSFQKLFKAA
jgi:hypothetical protein